MDKRQAEDILKQLNRVGKECGYKDVTVNSHLFHGIQHFLELLPKGDEKSSIAEMRDDLLDAITAVGIVSGGFRRAEVTQGAQ